MRLVIFSILCAIFIHFSAPGDSLLIEVREPGKIISVPQLYYPFYEAIGDAFYCGYVPAWVSASI